MLKYEGELCWKSALEYNPEGLLYGTPYFLITKAKEKYYLYEYNRKLQKYKVIMEYDRSKFMDLYRIGMAKEDALREKMIGQTNDQ